MLTVQGAKSSTRRGNEGARFLGSQPARTAPQHSETQPRAHHCRRDRSSAEITGASLVQLQFRTVAREPRGARAGWYDRAPVEPFIYERMWEFLTHGDPE